ncbi:uncharacterized protein LOC109611893 [Musca domestica]|uniref:Uncharacterized protein LOC109611893 n=1 Tax=Musca domestica TaxID=7370 RepID=A0ABM3V354_MUSDO|nr:uncharacterized protein LOC109611893 [Musca domestica]
MNPKRIFYWNGVMAIMLTLAIFMPTATNAIQTENDDVNCKAIQCPSSCPQDSYNATALEEEDGENEEDLDDSTYVEELGQFEELIPPEHIHHTVPHYLSKREVSPQQQQQSALEHCCGCVCNECNDFPDCSDDEVAIEVQKGQGVPGSCCPVYKCIPKITCAFGVKQSFWKSKCLKCSCFGENEMCEDHCPQEETIQSCFSDYYQQVMANGEAWMEGSCVSCSCDQGEKSCTTPICKSLEGECDNPIHDEDECCPRCPEPEEEIVKEKAEENVTEIAAMPEEVTREMTTQKTPNTTMATSTERVRSSMEPELKDVTTSATSTEKVMSSTVPELNKSPASETSTEKIMSSTEPVTEESSETPLIKISTTEKMEENLSSTSTQEEMSSTTENISSSTMKGVADSSVSVPDTTMENPTTPRKENLATTSEMVTTSTISREVESSTVTEEALSSTDNNHNWSSTLEPETTSEVLTYSTADRSSSIFVAETSTLAESSSQIPLEDSTSSSVAGIELTTLDRTSKAHTSTTEDTFAENIAIHSQDSTTQQTFRETTTKKDVEKHLDSSETYSTTEKISGNVPKTTTTLKNNINTPHTPPSTNSPFTTSSPYTPPEFTSSSSSSEIEHSSASTANPSTTTGPELLEPLPHQKNLLFEETNNYGSQSTQHQRRSRFDGIHYVIMIAIFIGVLLFIALFLIIRHTKNRKKMYSAIPYSETSLSQNSTHTMMTV